MKTLMIVGCVLLFVVTVMGDCGCLQCSKNLRVVSAPTAPVKVIYRGSPCHCPRQISYRVETPVIKQNPCLLRNYCYKMLPIEMTKPVRQVPLYSHNYQVQVPAQQCKPVNYLVGLVAAPDRIVLPAEDCPSPPPCGPPKTTTFESVSNLDDDNVYLPPCRSCRYRRNVKVKRNAEHSSFKRFKRNVKEIQHLISKSNSRSTNYRRDDISDNNRSPNICKESEDCLTGKKHTDSEIRLNYNSDAGVCRDSNRRNIEDNRDKLEQYIYKRNTRHDQTTESMFPKNVCDKCGTYISDNKDNFDVICENCKTDFDCNRAKLAANIHQKCQMIIPSNLDKFTQETCEQCRKIVETSQCRIINEKLEGNTGDADIIDDGLPTIPKQICQECKSNIHINQENNSGEICKSCGKIILGKEHECLIDQGNQIKKLIGKTHNDLRKHTKCKDCSNKESCDDNNHEKHGNFKDILNTRIRNNQERKGNIEENGCYKTVISNDQRNKNFEKFPRINVTSQELSEIEMNYTRGISNDLTKNGSIGEDYHKFYTNMGPNEKKIDEQIDLKTEEYSSPITIPIHTNFSEHVFLLKNATVKDNISNFNKENLGSTIRNKFVTQAIISNYTPENITRYEDHSYRLNITESLKTKNDSKMNEVNKPTKDQCNYLNIKISKIADESSTNVNESEFHDSENKNTKTSHKTSNLATSTNNIDEINSSGIKNKAYSVIQLPTLDVSSQYTKNILRFDNINKSQEANNGVTDILKSNDIHSIRSNVLPLKYDHRNNDNINNRGQFWTDFLIPRLEDLSTVTKYSDFRRKRKYKTIEEENVEKNIREIFFNDYSHEDEKKPIIKLPRIRPLFRIPLGKRMKRDFPQITEEENVGIKPLRKFHEGFQATNKEYNGALSKCTSNKIFRTKVEGNIGARPLMRMRRSNLNTVLKTEEENTLVGSYTENSSITQMADNFDKIYKPMETAESKSNYKSEINYSDDIFQNSEKVGSHSSEKLNTLDPGEILDVLGEEIIGFQFTENQKTPDLNQKKLRPLNDMKQKSSTRRKRDYNEIYEVRGESSVKPSDIFFDSINWDDVIPQIPLFFFINAPVRMLKHFDKLKNHLEPVIDCVPTVIDTSKKYIQDFGRKFKRSAVGFANNIFGGFTKSGFDNNFLDVIDLNNIFGRINKRSLPESYKGVVDSYNEKTINKGQFSNFNSTIYKINEGPLDIADSANFLENPNKKSLNEFLEIVQCKINPLGGVDILVKNKKIKSGDLVLIYENYTLPQQIVYLGKKKCSHNMDTQQEYPAKEIIDLQEQIYLNDGKLDIGSLNNFDNLQNEEINLDISEIKPDYLPLEQNITNDSKPNSSNLQKEEVGLHYDKLNGLGLEKIRKNLSEPNSDNLQENGSKLYNHNLNYIKSQEVKILHEINDKTKFVELQMELNSGDTQNPQEEIKVTEKNSLDTIKQKSNDLQVKLGMLPSNGNYRRVKRSLLKVIKEGEIMDLLREKFSLTDDQRVFEDQTEDIFEKHFNSIPKLRAHYENSDKFNVVLQKFNPNTLLQSKPDTYEEPITGFQSRNDEVLNFNPETNLQVIKNEITRTLETIHILIQTDYTQDIKILNSLLKLQIMKDNLTADWKKTLLDGKEQNSKIKLKILHYIQELMRYKKTIMHSIVQQLKSRNTYNRKNLINTLIQLFKIQLVFTNITEDFSEKIKTGAKFNPTNEASYITHLNKIKILEQSKSEIETSLKITRDNQLQKQMQILEKLKTLLDPNDLDDVIREEINQKASLIRENVKLAKLQRIAIRELSSRSQNLRRKLKSVHDLQMDIDKNCEELLGKEEEVEEVVSEDEKPKTGLKEKLEEFIKGFEAKRDAWLEKNKINITWKPLL